MCTLRQSWFFSRNNISRALSKQYGSLARAHKEKQQKQPSKSSGPFAVSRLCPWKSEVQFSNSLIDHGILYNKEGLVMVNKPYGVATHSSLSQPKIGKDRNQKILSKSICDYTLSQSLPHLAKALGYDTLSIVRAPERYTSGVAILTAKDAVMAKVRQCLKRSKPAKKFTETYLAVTVGVPDPIKAMHRLGITLKVDERSSHKYPDLQTEWSSRAERRGDVKVASASHRLLVGSRIAGLVELQTSTARWHFLRALLARLRSPVLGDGLYGASVATVMGVRLSVPPAVGTRQKLSAEMLDALGLKAGQEDCVPTHLHLWRQTLLGYLEDGKDLVVEAPISETFVETCRKLELRLEPETGIVTENN